MMKFSVLGANRRDRHGDCEPRLGAGSDLQSRLLRAVLSERQLPETREAETLHRDYQRHLAYRDDGYRQGWKSRTGTMAWHQSWNDNSYAWSGDVTEGAVGNAYRL